MALEIERKFLLKDSSWRGVVQTETVIKQGYLNSAIERTLRVRVLGDKGFLTIKGKTENLTRKEFEYEVPLEEAVEMIALSEKPIIEKIRYTVELDGLLWEIDEFFGINEGLIVAEVELKSEEQRFILPEWIGVEVSSDSRYYNSALLSNPYSTWDK